MQVIKWGQSVYANSQKFVEFYLTPIVATLIVNTIVAISSSDASLSAIQVCPISVSIYLSTKYKFSFMCVHTYSS